MSNRVSEFGSPFNNQDHGKPHDKDSKKLLNDGLESYFSHLKAKNLNLEQPKKGFLYGNSFTLPLLGAGIGFGFSAMFVTAGSKYLPFLLTGLGAVIGYRQYSYRHSDQNAFFIMRNWDLLHPLVQQSIKSDDHRYMALLPENVSYDEESLNEQIKNLKDAGIDVPQAKYDEVLALVKQNQEAKAQ